MIATLVDRGHAVVVFDLPAHGYSDGEWGLGFEAADAARAVAETLGPIEAIVAHSMGASAAGLAVAGCRGALIAPLRGGNRWRRSPSGRAVVGLRISGGTLRRPHGPRRVTVSTPCTPAGLPTRVSSFTRSTTSGCVWSSHEVVPRA
jgi:pimeloyl-ACP methyl ester carboxylesterase